MIDLSNWKLTLPVNSKGVTSGTGDATEVLKLENYSKSPYFTLNPDSSRTFMAPTDGARTGGSKYPRSELRQMKAGDEYEWTVEQGGRLEATLKVDAVPLALVRDKKDLPPGTQGAVVVGQIHGPDDELCRLYFDRGVVYFYDDKAGSSPKETLFILKDANGKETNIKLGDRFSYSIVADKTALTVTVVHNDIVYKAVDPISKFWPGKKLYFKAGVYPQVSKPGSNAGTIGSGYGQATFYSIVLDGVTSEPPVVVEPPKAKTITKVVVTYSDGTTATL